jgi:hypothetical protein
MSRSLSRGAIAAILAVTALMPARLVGAAHETTSPDSLAVAAPAVPTAADPAATPVPSPPLTEFPALVRVSTSFEAKHAAAVLRQVAKLYSAGFVRKDAERVATEIDALPAEVSRVWDFSAVHKHSSYALRVRARLDEFGNLDLDFFSAPEMAAAVRGAVDRYLNARGL